MIHRLRELESEGNRLRIGLAGAGAMGRGIALQIAATPGMELAWVVDKDHSAAQSAALLGKAPLTGSTVSECLEQGEINVFVEATNSIGPAAEYCLQAIAAGADVVLMNAEVDLVVGPALAAAAEHAGVVISSDAGDQHGVLATMIDEAELMGFQIVQAGNIKGFLDREATPESIKHEAEKRKLSATQCCAYTDGTKLHIEMAVLANCYGYLPPKGGMTGPRAGHVTEAIEKFDLESYSGQPRVDYLLGAEPGGGVYLIVKAGEGSPDEQAFLLNYYKLGDGPYYLLYRPYHLCHLETPRAIAQVALDGAAVLAPRAGRVTDVYAYAKSDLKVGQEISHAIGSAECYGLIGEVEKEEQLGKVPIALLEQSSVLTRNISAGEAITFTDLAMPDTALLNLWKTQLA